MTVLIGLLYPFVVTVFAQLFFPSKANGSLIVKDGEVIGSELIGQPFNSMKYFWSRPSATAPFPYNASASSGSNLGPLNPNFKEGVRNRVTILKGSEPDNTKPIPIDLVTASASGLDPHISPMAALYQAGRVARARGLDIDNIRALVSQYIENKQIFVLGEPRVNVLKLNLALDEVERKSQ